VPRRRRADVNNAYSVHCTPELFLAAEPCSGSGLDAASIEWLPGEVLGLVFGFVGAKTLT